MVLKSPHVLAAIDRVTFESTSGASATKEDAAKAAKAIFEGMYADINDANVRTAIYFMRKVWRTMYEGIRVNESGIAMLHEYAAQRKPVVLLPMHKSHVDYLLLSYVCTAYNLYPPHIIAGDNLSMPIVGNILKHGGGVFIRRVFGSDELYKTIFAEYIATLIKNGHMLECFIEGTRSRMGKLKTPKIGFLSVLVDLLLTGRLGDVEDVMLVPIAISYDKVIEGSTYVSEMLGATKRKESLTETLNSVNKYIRLNFGSIDVSICEGISLRDSLAAYASAAVPNPAEGASLFLQYTQNEQKVSRREQTPTFCVADFVLTQPLSVPCSSLSSASSWVWLTRSVGA
jgi:glycerol-3-phosphate O-acyltransferase